MKKFHLTFLLILFVSLPIFAQNNQAIELLIRVDDSGMSHSSNSALEKLAQTGLPFSTSIMFACPWYQESVQLVKKYPLISVGIHLTLNSEWEFYRWGPVAGRTQVPSIVDSLGFFVPSRAAFDKLNPQLHDIETELRAQIERALSSGVKIDYVDYHMGTAVDKPERRALLERLAKEYGLGISRYFGEQDMDIMYAKPIEDKQAHLLNETQGLNAKQINLLVCHILDNTPEVQALNDLNSFGLKQMSAHRNAELNALLSPEFIALIKKRKINLVTYRDLIQRFTLKKMDEFIK